VGGPALLSISLLLLLLLLLLCLKFWVLYYRTLSWMIGLGGGDLARISCFGGDVVCAYVFSVSRWIE
jgi:hypothetical protein